MAADMDVAVTPSRESLTLVGETLSPALRERVLRCLDDNAAASMPLSPATLAEARRRFLAMQARCRPGDATEWARFLTPLLAVARRVPEPDRFKPWLSVAVAALWEVPVAALSAQRALAACTRFKDWPAVPELHAWLLAEARPLFWELSALRRIVAAAAAPPVQPSPDPPVDPMRVARAAAETRAALMAMEAGRRAREASAVSRPVSGDGRLPALRTPAELGLPIDGALLIPIPGRALARKSEAGAGNPGLGVSPDRDRPDSVRDSARLDGTRV